MPIDPLLMFVELMQRAGVDAPRVDRQAEREQTARERLEYLHGPRGRAKAPTRPARRGRWVPVPTFIACSADDPAGVYRAVVERVELHREGATIEVTEPGHLDDVVVAFRVQQLQVGGMRLLRFDRFESRSR